jgi:hypothetical protein
LGLQGAAVGSNVSSDSSADNSIAIHVTATMAPNLALYKRVLIQSIIESKLRGDGGVRDDKIADIYSYKHEGESVASRLQLARSRSLV